MSRVKALRPIVVVILLIAGAGGGYLSVALQRTADSLVTSQLDVAASIGRMEATATAITAAQEAYVAPGQPDEPWLERVSQLVQELATTSANIRPRLRSTEAAEHLQTLSAALESLLAIDGRVRESLRNGQDLTASDLIFTDARDTVASIVTTLKALDQNERVAVEAERAALGQQRLLLLGIVGAIWAVGLVLLVRQPPAPDRGQIGVRSVSGSESETVPEPTAAPSFTMDLDGAAQICTDISRVTSADALPDLLARAAAVLDASGIILWIGAGEELFAVTAHGYDRKVVSRLGPIGRHANNATAAAWRTGELRTVSGDMMSNGAIVAPMFGVDTCIGVLAAEIRHGRESDPSTRALTAMFAAQFATVVAAWPAPSEAPAPKETDSTDPFAASL